ncbi:phage integrase family protein [Murinocardiopsis flavida]|uniref:Phage integrase family protein n=2 Tax=Murinocardiopsis flavida TaxID=645275 RepID=A0A2P8D3G2_9ACTN|nr:phage integrase family protein [Murinocardiopsis flavida]
MPGGQDIQFWEIRKRAGRSKPFELRWRIDQTQKSRSFLTKELARNHETALRAAARAGDVFSLSSGEPLAWERGTESFYGHAVAYARHAWGLTDSGNTRRTIADNTARLILAAVDDKAVKRAPSPASLREVRSALVSFALSFDTDTTANRPEDRVTARPCPDARTAALLTWAEQVSRPVSDFSGAEAVRALLDRACLRIDGTGASAAGTIRRRRGVLLAVLDHAVARGLLATNPMAGLKVRRARVSDAVNPRTVPDTAQSSRLITAVADSTNPTDRYLAAFFVLAYLAGTRPGETRAVARGDITWPEHITHTDAVPGWGLLTAAGSRTEVGASYTDAGSAGESRELKQRATGDVRRIPLPPEAVAVLRWHLAEFGTAPDGRLFWHLSATDAFATLPGKVYRRAWKRARAAVLTDAERAARLAERPYDLRHACASLLINLGVPAPDVAYRLGHSVEVLLTTYTHWFTSQTHASNKIIDQALSEIGPVTGQLLENDAETEENTRSDGHDT